MHGNGVPLKGFVFHKSACCRKTLENNKVRLRERKRHTARLVASTLYTDLSPGGGGGDPTQSWMGGGDPIQSWTGGYHIQSWMRGYPLQDQDGGTLGSPCPDLGWGHTLPLSAGWDTPCLELGWMGYPSPIRIWDGVSSPSGPGMGYHPLPPGPGTGYHPPRRGVN